MTLRSAFVAEVSDVLDWDDDVVLVIGDISAWAFRRAAEKHPKRVLNLGVTEQGSVAFCAGLAMSGMYPIFHTIDSFLIRRAYEFIYLDFGLQKLPGMFVTVGGERDYARLGPTHCCGEGPLLMAQVPGMRGHSPITETRVRSSIVDSVAARSLCYIRLEESLAVVADDNVVPLHLGANGHAVTVGADG